MGGSHLWFFVCVALAALAYGGEYNIRDILQQVPESERPAFLKHHIMLGYELSQAARGRKVKTPTDDINVPNDFSIFLYKTTLENHQITDPKLLQLLSNVICFPNGQCIDIGDIGIHPYSSA